MDIIEELMIILAISLDIFAVMECQGSLVAKVDKKQLTLLCTILVVGQAVALGIGTALSVLLYHYRLGEHETFLGRVLAAVILLCMGVRLLLKAWKNEGVNEHRRDRFDILEFVKLYARISIFTLLTGVAFGFLESSVTVILVLISLMTILVTVLGMYTGYRLGFEHKIKAYMAGGILLIVAGIEVMI